MKFCTKCELEKEKKYFSKDKSRKDALCVWCKECTKKYQTNNKEKLLAYNKKYKEDNKEKINKQSLKYYNDKYKIDIQFKLGRNLRTRFNHALKDGYKQGSAVRDLGCSIEYLKIYLEQQFIEGMTWENHGIKDKQWSIDHIKPLSKFDLTNREQLLESVNYRNLRPLWHVDNRIKSDNF